MKGCSITGIVSRDWRSKAQYKFGQHYSTILARTLGIIFWHSSWPETGKLIEILRFPASSMTAPGYYQVATIAPIWILQIMCSKEIYIEFTAPPVTFFLHYFSI